MVSSTEDVDGEMLFDLLHTEMVQFLHNVTAKDAKVEAISKLEEMGYRVGVSLTERFTRETARFVEELEVLKYICKEFWVLLYKKQIDSLRTNHQLDFKYSISNLVVSFAPHNIGKAQVMGIYVLQDNDFKVLSKLSSISDKKEEANKLLAFPCGLLRGAMTALGVPSCVTADMTGLPACSSPGLAPSHYKAELFSTLSNYIIPYKPSIQCYKLDFEPFKCHFPNETVDFKYNESED